MQNQADSVEKLPPSPSDAPSYDHLNNFNEFFEHLNRAAKSVLPRVCRRHTGAFVLLLRWEDDNLGTEIELKDLEEVFRDVYHYNTEQYLIPSNDSTIQLEYKLNDFRRTHDNGTNLLIIYYGGHGSLDYGKKRPNRSIWQVNQNGGPTLVVRSTRSPRTRQIRHHLYFRLLLCCQCGKVCRFKGGALGVQFRSYYDRR